MRGFNQSGKSYKIYGFIVSLAIVVSLFLGIGIGYMLFYPAPVNNFHPIREQDTTSKYKFISPLLAYDTPNNPSSKYKKMRDELENYIDTIKKNGDTGSVYFRDLATGEWIGVNENVGYPPASMLKVIIMIAYLKHAEVDHNLLNSKLEYTHEMKKVIEQSVHDSPTELQVGKYYKVDNLIEKMIISSDNGAKDALLANINEDFLDQIYNDLGLNGPNGINEYDISPSQYSLFFRVLYNATYLNRDMSEYALSLLGKAEFGDGLRQGVPDAITIAHKFGEYMTSSLAPNSIALHDCGIVYKPENSYFICIMTRGSSLPVLQGYIKDISSMVYNVK
jgi:beta-lactamase class A